MVTKDIAERFAIAGTFLRAAPYSGGHINDTFLAVFEAGSGETKYIIQRINKKVFRNPQAVMENMVRVTEHIRGKLTAVGVSDIDRRVLTVIPNRNGDHYVIDTQGCYWRATRFLEGAQTYDVPQSPEQIYEAARAFGLFQKLLSDLPGKPLHETIEGFHDGRRFFAVFAEAMESDPFGRAGEVAGEIDFVKTHRGLVNQLQELIDRRMLPIRNTHNDTKVNNVLIDDESGEAICVIDLDTVMPRCSLFDFGDLVRTTVTTAGEDEEDVSTVAAERRRYEAVLTGFLKGTGGLLCKEERENLFLGAAVIVYNQVVRFLGDYLAGDVYYKTTKANHNLLRTRTQIKLLQELLADREALEAMATNGM